MICNDYECIFVHVPKTAGQSIEQVFLDEVGLSWDERGPLLLRRNDDPSAGPPRLAHLKVVDYVRYGYIPMEAFERYFKFAFVRNPWSRVVSLYNYRGYQNEVEFKRYLAEDFPALYARERWFYGPQSELLCDDAGRLVVDFVGRFESLQADFDIVCQKIDFPRTELPHANRSEDRPDAFELLSSLVRPRRFIRNLAERFATSKMPPLSSWRDYYDEESKQIVADVYRSDIELFGYAFE